MTPLGICLSEWPSVRETCHRLGWGFDGWQDGAGMLILSLRADGEYAADTIVISIPRQVGKTYVIGCIIFALCLMKPGLKVIWTAQVKDTALETFSQFFDMSQRPKVKPHILKVLQGKGDESILFNNGSSIEFGARDSGFGRGRTDVDVIVFDEGQHLSTEALENMGAAQNVAQNPLCFVMGTPPRPKDKGEFFSLLRREALDGESEGTLYIEMSADRDADPMDREQWRKANPSFPNRTSERAMLRLRKKLKNPDSWAREALGIWDEDDAGWAVFSSSSWKKAHRAGRKLRGTPSLALAASPDLAWAAIGAANLKGQIVWGKVLAHGPGVAWVAEAAKKLQDKHRSPLVVHEVGPCSSILTELQDAGVNLRLVTSGAVADAEAALSTAVMERGTFRDATDLALSSVLTEAARIAQWRPMSDRRVFDRKVGDISTLEAISLAAADAVANNYDVMDSFL